MKLRSMLACVLAAGLVAPAAFSAPPRQVVIDPVQVAFDKTWLVNMNEPRGRAHAVGEEDAKRIAAEFAASLHGALAEAVKARGFEIVGVPTSGAIRLSAKIENLYVNAPEVHASGITRSFVREAGRATLRAEGRDATGALRMQSEVRATAGDTGNLTRATDVSNRFWFDAMFRNWAREVAGELGDTAAP